ncbi:MAG: segregation/condensation protein A [Lachnospiraceae bacterium]|nr:segregation/condensation protein A [Lachnospiraceae bacterium]
MILEPLDVTLDVFEGPLDLLLYLIEKNKVDIYDIPISVITDQYMEYLSDVRSGGMDVMSEFVLMAATLLDIKCRMLLPGNKEEEEDESDPREELVERLLEYKMCRSLSDELKLMYEGHGMVTCRSKSIPAEVSEFIPPVDYPSLIGDNTLIELRNIFDSLMKRQEDKVDRVRSRFGKIEREQVDIGARTEYIRTFIGSHKTFSFRNLLSESGGRMECIVTFLVILEFMKNGIVRASQDGNGSDIIITAA